MRRGWRLSWTVSKNHGRCIEGWRRARAECEAALEACKREGRNPDECLAVALAGQWPVFVETGA